MFVSPSYFHVETLMSSVMVLADGAFEKFLSHEGGALMHGISAL